MQAALLGQAAWKVDTPAGLAYIALLSVAFPPGAPLGPQRPQMDTI